MNTPKKGNLVNNSWMLCPSKSFPGKFYYFNVATGEAVWSINNNEKVNLRKESTPNIQNVNNCFHGFPEPTTPPDNSFDTTPANTWPCTSTSSPWSEPKRPSFPNNNFLQPSFTSNPWLEYKTFPFQNEKYAHQAPVFGQSAQFVPSLGQMMPGIPNVMPNLIWTPIQLSMPGWPQMPTNTRLGIDRDTQTCPLERELFVHASGVPLCQKFINFESPSLCFDNDNKIVTKFQPSSPVKSPISKSSLSKCIKKQVINMETTQNSTLDEESGENSTLNTHKKIDFLEMETEPQVKDRNSLQKNDLRFLLLAKRRKSFDANNEFIERKRTKVEYQTPLKKKVTFNLSNQDSPSISSIDEGKIVNPKFSPFNKAFYKIPMSPTQTTLNYYSLLESNVPKKDNIDICDNIQSNMFNQSDNIPMQNTSTQDIILSNDTPESDSPMYNLEKIETDKNISRTNAVATENIPDHNSAKSETQKGNPRYSETSKSIPKNIEMAKIVPKCTEISENKAIANCDTNSTPSLVQSEFPNESAVENDGTGLPTPYVVSDVWYLVVDIDVLLDYLELIDKILNSDEKCRLLIPQCIRSELNALCIGDCQGQKRVFVARQLSRRLNAPQKQCVVELLPDQGNNNISDLKDDVLKCCVQVAKNQHYVVLLTNDVPLKAKAKALNINCCSTEQIINGAIVRPKLFSELKKMKVIVNNNNKNSIESETNPKDSDTESKVLVNTFKKRLFENNIQTNKNCDILINITKPGNAQLSDNNKVNAIEINNHVRLQTLKNTINRNFDNRSTVFNKLINISDKTNEYLDTNKDNQHSNSNTLKTITLQKSNTIETSFRDEHQDPHICKDTVDSSPGQNTLLHITDTESYPISNSNESNIGVQDSDTIKFSHTASGQRIKTIISALNSKSSQRNILNQSDPSDSFNFKVPKPKKFKNGTTKASTIVRSPAPTDETRSKFKKSVPWLEIALKDFSVKNIQDKIINKMDEWTCTYSQVMEHLLADILQNRSEYVKHLSFSDRNLHDSLTCLKMIYEDKKLRNIIELLLEMLDRYTCSKGKLQLDTPPSDLMRMIGCGLLLIETLETILPDIQLLAYYKSALKSLISNIKSKSVDLDPELLRPTAVCRSEIDDTNKENRCNFSKEPSMIIEYLKKHYKEWASYDENQNVKSSSKCTSKGDYKIVRMFGKNVNKLKLDSNKSFTYNKLTIDYNEENETKSVRRLATKQPNTEPAELKKAKQKLKRSPLQTQNIDDLSKSNKCDKEKIEITKHNITSPNTEPKILKYIEKMSKDDENKCEEHVHTFSKLEDGPKMIRNIKTIDEYENKIKDKQPLDLERLDYSPTSDNFCNMSNNFHENFINFDDDDINKDHFDNSDQSDFHINFDDYKSVPNQYHITNKKENTRFAQDNIIKKNIVINPSIFDNFDNNLKIFNAKYKKDFKKDNKVMRDEMDHTNEPVYQNESTEGHTVLKIFLIELSRTFKIVYEFIVEFVKEIRDDILSEERKNTLYYKSSKFLEATQAVVQQLQSIIARESYKVTALNTLQFISEVGAYKDPKMTQYRQVVSKCLQQAKILQNALKIIVGVTIGDLDAISNNADSITSSIRHFAI